METSDIFGLLPTLLKIVGDKIVGFDDRIRKRFNHAIENALKPNDESYINKVQVHLAELICLIILVMDEPSSINTITMPNYISRDEFRRLYDQTKKDEYLWRVIQEEWNQYKAKDTNNIVKTTYNLIVDRISSEEDIKQGIEKIIEILEETKSNTGSEKNEKVLSLSDYLKEKLEQKRKNHPSFKLMDIDKDLFPDGMITFETEALDSDDQLKSVKDIVAESWNKQEQNHLMIEGKGGIGKTVTLLYLPDKFAPRYVPAVYIPLHELKGETNTIEKYIKSQILDYNDNEVRFGQLMDTVGKPWNKGPRLLMLLDGFNEIPNERRADISIDIEHWSERPGVQIITSSRYDIHQYVALCSSFSKIELQPLKEEKVEAYLKKKGFDVPANPAVISLITTPLLLTLYIRTEKLRINRKSPLADFSETKNAGMLIWNYLQSELWRYRARKEEAKACVLAMEFVAPYIAWTMQQHTDFVLNEDDFLDRLDKAYTLLKANFGNTVGLPKHIKTTVKQTSGQLPEYAFIRDLLQEQLSLFNRQERKDAYNNTVVEYRLMHQQFRDALAAIHLINSIYLSGDSRPTEWNSTVDHYVLQFVVDLISEEEADRLWEQNRKTTPAIEDAIRNQLRLQGLLHDNDFSHLDFSRLDLSSISLFPYRTNLTTIKLSTQSERLNKTKITGKTFSAEGHYDSVTAVAITPNGKQLISGSKDNTIRIWDIETGENTNTLKGHEGWIQAVTVTPNGDQVISGSTDGTVCIWDIKTGGKLKTLKGHKTAVYALDVSLNGKQIVSGSDDGIIRIWDIDNSDNNKILNGHWGSVRAITIIPNKKQVVSGSADGTIRIWDMETGESIRTLGQYGVSIYAIALSPNGKQIVSGSNDGFVYIWDIETGKILKTSERHKKAVDTVAVTSNGEQIVSGSKDCIIHVWDITTGKKLKTMSGQKSEVYAVALTPNRKQVVSGLKDGTIRIWDLKTNKILRTLERHERTVYTVALTPNGKQIVSWLADNTIRIWDIESGENLRTVEKYKDFGKVIAVTSDIKQVVSGSREGTVFIYSLETGEVIRTLEGNKKAVYSLAITPDEKKVIGCSSDGACYIWDMESGRMIRTQEEQDDWIRALAVTNEKLVVSYSYNNIVRFRDIETGEILKTIKGYKLHEEVGAITPDGKQVISGRNDGTIHIWDIETGENKTTIQILPFSLIGLDFSEAEITDDKLKETLRQNGAKV